DKAKQLLLKSKLASQAAILEEQGSSPLAREGGTDAASKNSGATTSATKGNKDSSSNPVTTSTGATSISGKPKGTTALERMKNRLASRREESQHLKKMKEQGEKHSQEAAARSKEDRENKRRAAENARLAEELKQGEKHGSATEIRAILQGALPSWDDRQVKARDEGRSGTGKTTVLEHRAVNYILEFLAEEERLQELRKQGGSMVELPAAPFVFVCTQSPKLAVVIQQHVREHMKVIFPQRKDGDDLGMEDIGHPSWLEKSAGGSLASLDGKCSGPLEQHAGAASTGGGQHQNGTTNATGSSHGTNTSHITNANSAAAANIASGCATLTTVNVNDKNASASSKLFQIPDGPQIFVGTYAHYLAMIDTAMDDGCQFFEADKALANEVTFPYFWEHYFPKLSGGRGEGRPGEAYTLFTEIMMLKGQAALKSQRELLLPSLKEIKKRATCSITEEDYLKKPPKESEQSLSEEDRAQIYKQFQHYNRMLADRGEWDSADVCEHIWRRFLFSRVKNN
ncbi:unnamed protein product, partial [Amoebophrya sp. A120]